MKRQDIAGALLVLVFVALVLGALAAMLTHPIS
jgi:hypothetical protein